mgnify:CR=1 FL=1
MLKRIAMVAATLLLTAFGWRQWQSGAAPDWLAPPPPRPAPFQFDNGTVRQYQPSVSAGPLQPRGGARKCRKGRETVYTDGPCPGGSEELPLQQGTLNQVPAAAPTEKPARKPPPAAANEPAGTSAGDTRLRERLVERAVSGRPTP